MDETTLLYTNVVGVAPSSNELAYYRGLLDTNAYTVPMLGILAAETGENAANINLIGIMQHGLGYLP